MSSRTDGERVRWTLAIGGAAVLGGAVLMLFRAPDSAQRNDSAKTESAGRVGLTKVVGGEAALLDKTPLFLPTEWNTAQKTVTPPQSGGAFSDYAPKFAYDEAELKPLKPNAPITFTTADALSLVPPGPALLGFGRTELAPERLEARGAFLEIVTAKGGQSVLTKSVSEAKPPTAAIWSPLEFLATVDAAGLTGPLVLTSRSGIEEVDTYFQKYLTQNLHIGALVGPGVYRVSVGP